MAPEVSLPKYGQVFDDRLGSSQMMTTDKTSDHYDANLQPNPFRAVDVVVNVVISDNVVFLSDVNHVKRHF